MGTMTLISKSADSHEFRTAAVVTRDGKPRSRSSSLGKCNTQRSTKSLRYAPFEPERKKKVTAKVRNGPIISVNKLESKYRISNSSSIEAKNREKSKTLLARVPKVKLNNE